VQGRERMIRPNHVTINSKTSPITFRNFTIVDQNSGEPLQRIWVSVYKENGKKYFSISESRWNGSWKTTSNIIVPPEATAELQHIIEFIKSNLN
jgi:frataxin-like iron-binding protein CyaY